MIKPSIILLLSLCYFTKISLAVEKCASQIKLNQLFEQYPEKKAEMDSFNANYDKIDLSSFRTGAVTVNIPIVVHVLYNNSTQNISDAQIQSQIDVLNQDFNNLNSDKLANTHPFYSSIGNANITFCLATTDPNGNATSGIERKQVSQNSFDAEAADETIIKKSVNGGIDGWDKTKYLNIWIVKFDDGTLGYGTFPDETPAIYDGLVVDYRAFGTIGQASYPYNKGRTTTHELGHWLNLFHIWGDSFCGNDFVNDTPKQEAENYDCPTFPININGCSGATGSNGEMFMNYMDYVDDACMNMFTNGQVTRMYAVLNTYRSSFINNTSCGSVSAIHNSNLDAIKVYPNPAVNYFYIDGLSTTNDLYTVRIYNEVGQLIKQQQLQHQQEEIAIFDLINGNYIVNISNSSNNITKKLIILH